MKGIFKTLITNAMVDVYRIDEFGKRGNKNKLQDRQVQNSRDKKSTYVIPINSLTQETTCFKHMHITETS